ncbi:(2Fe-2S)-binding protein [Thermogladius sp. 4427co]|uniref:(2Fe-2S)-binding protein n=1 Tax=Thermogladius sp. 4427co TaxID=3450718 RepID=UPI003F79EB61
MKIKFKLNGRMVEADVEPNELLLNVLRDKFKLTGAKYGCGIGECGACTVLVDGKPVLSCLTLAVDVDGREVVTVEGLAGDGGLTPVQKAFIEEGAIQCGYCIPGFVMVGEYLYRKGRRLSEEEIRKYIRGNLCRCTGYVNIVKALEKALGAPTR